MKSEHGEPVMLCRADEMKARTLPGSSNCPENLNLGNRPNDLRLQKNPSQNRVHRCFILARFRKMWLKRCV